MFRTLPASLACLLACSVYVAGRSHTVADPQLIQIAQPVAVNSTVFLALADKGSQGHLIGAVLDIGGNFELHGGAPYHVLAELRRSVWGDGWIYPTPEAAAEPILSLGPLPILDWVADDSGEVVALTALQPGSTATPVYWRCEPGEAMADCRPRLRAEFAAGIPAFAAAPVSSDVAIDAASSAEWTGNGIAVALDVRTQRGRGIALLHVPLTTGPARIDREGTGELTRVRGDILGAVPSAASSATDPHLLVTTGGLLVDWIEDAAAARIGYALVDHGRMRAPGYYDCAPAEPVGSCRDRLREGFAATP